MTITVEDGTIVSGANSYVTEAALTSYASDRNITLSGSYTNEQLLHLAMDYIDSLPYKGLKRRSTQVLQWPRVNVYLDGYYNDVDNIPAELKNGQLQTAIAIDQGNSPQQVKPRQTLKEKVGDLEVQYANSSNAVDIDRKIRGFLWKLLGSGYGGANTKASKG